MLVVTVVDTSDEVWSLTGWSLKYKQLDPTTYGWYLVDPSGVSHKSLINQLGMNVQYNVKSFDEFLKSVESNNFTKDAIRKYVAKTVGYSSIDF